MVYRPMISRAELAERLRRERQHDPDAQLASREFPKQLDRLRAEHEGICTNCGEYVGGLLICPECRQQQRNLA